jgi:cytoskeletal protein CcmA (bactofilin family)
MTGDVVVDGDVSSVNGKVDAGPGTEIRGDVSTVNGPIVLAGTTVDRDVRTHNGALTLKAGTRVRGEIRVERSRGSRPRRSRLEIRLEGGTVVEGDLVVEAGARPVTVYLDSDSSVQGEIRNAEVVRM